MSKKTHAFQAEVAQLEILKMFSKPMPQTELMELKKTLVNFLTKRIDSEVDDIVRNKKLTPEKMEMILNTHIKRSK